MTKMNRALIETALTLSHPIDWVSEMSSSKLIRPRMRPADLPGPGREATVMLLIYPQEDGELHTVLTRRPDDLQHHPGQVSLPGGRREPNEPFERTGLREVEEEIGIPQSAVSVLGTLNPIYVPPSDFTVTPMVGWLEAEPTFVLQVDEVAELIRVPLSLFFDRSIRRCSAVNNDKHERDVPWFAVEHHQVWGATAIILDDFVQRVERV
jgi:8-oxo-dGTP pyrophosphatase MutT (NUDIX family)